MMQQWLGGLAILVVMFLLIYAGSVAADRVIAWVDLQDASEAKRERHE